MTLRRLMLLSLFRFRRTNLGVLLGIALASTVITGALVVGDSMRGTLKRTAELRLGGVAYAVLGADRLFTESFAQRIAPNASAALLLEGVASTPDGRARADRVSVVGVDAYSADHIDLRMAPPPGEAFLNDVLADQLGAKVGDTILLRLPKPSALPIDAALVNASKPAVAINLIVSKIVDESRAGRFSLRAEQRPPMNLFIDHAWLAEQLDVPGRVNAAFSMHKPGPIKPKLGDLELALKPSDNGRAALTSPRIFLDRSIEHDLADLPGQRLLTYMVNTIALGESESPYAMVTAANELGDLELANDEIAINQWLAEDLGASVGDTLRLTYFLPDEGDRLVEADAVLKVARIVPLEGVYADRTLTPEFPGLAEAETLSRWDAGPAIDRSQIRDQDEAYWEAYRATPKAFINLHTGQRLWANRFGTLTAIRFNEGMTDAQLLGRIDSEALGFTATNIRAQADAAAVGTVDFGQLFLSLSAFIIIAAIVLAAMLFAMSAQQRAKQLGTLLAIGLTQRQVTQLLLGEGLIIALAGSVLGIAGALGYATGVTHALSSVWSGAVAGAPVLLHISATSLIAGPLATLSIALIAMTLSTYGLTRYPVRQLLAGGVGKVSPRPRLSFKYTASVALLTMIAGMVLAIINPASGMKAAMAGFIAGGLFFAGCLLLLLALLAKDRRTNSASRVPRLAYANLTRRRGGTATAVFMLGAGLFLVFAVSGFHLNTDDDTAHRASGTGGFALLVESSQPIRYDLNTGLGRDHYALTERELPPGSVVPMRVSRGDDASCLNLNQTPTPRLLGADPGLFATREAFTFFQEQQAEEGWNALVPHANDAIPAIADANTAQWALKLAVGDTMLVRDEKGVEKRLRLVATIENSILQGSLIIHEDAFKRMFPSASGHRLLLVDPIPGQSGPQTSELLNEVLLDEGVRITPTNERLAEYNRVQNTYLAVFQLLGGLGVLIGALGLGIVTARNLLERRSELALLSAVGWSKARIARLILIEHTAVLLTGLLLGLTSAAVATHHASGGTEQLSWIDAMPLLAPLAAGLCAIMFALAPLRTRRLIDTLRND